MPKPADPMASPGRRLRTAALAFAALLAPASIAAAPGDGAKPLLTLEGDRVIWHRGASPGEAALIVGVARRAMAAAGDTSLRTSEAALTVLSKHALTTGWALLRRGQLALAAGDSARADSLLEASARRFGLWQSDARRLRHDVALSAGDLRRALGIVAHSPGSAVSDGRSGEWLWLSARLHAALGDTTAAVRALERMQSAGTPKDSARRALLLLDALAVGATGLAPGEDQRLAARLMSDARDLRGRAERLERALEALVDSRARFETALDLASAWRRTDRTGAALALLDTLRLPAQAGLADTVARPIDDEMRLDGGRRLVARADVERAAGRLDEARRRYAGAAALLRPTLWRQPSPAALAVYREAVLDQADLAFTRGQVSRAREALAMEPREAPDHGAWQLRAGVLSMLLGERRRAEGHFEAADDGAFWLGLLRRRAGDARGDSLLAAAAGRDDFEFYAAAARESLGMAPRAIAPAGALPGPGGPAWLREAELLVWLGETDDAATLVERAIDWHAAARANGTLGEIGFPQGSHWLRAARIAYLAGRPHVGIRLAHRPRWRERHELPADVDREAVLPWMYPPAYDSLYAEHGARRRIEPALLSAIGWQESFFDARAVSRAGALGVMQFMPATARLVARGMGEPEPSETDLLEAERSIRLGAEYFAGLLRQFGGAVPPALAAYNAGPGRARTWIHRANGDRGALFCEVIGFDETINYVKNILGAWQAYRWMGPRWE